MTNLKCVECGSKMTSAREDWRYDESGLDVVLGGIEVRRCARCHNVEPVIPNLPGLHRVLARFVATAPLSLGPKEFAFLAKYIEYSSIATLKPIARGAYLMLRVPFVPERIRERAIAILCAFAVLVTEREEAELTQAETPSTQQKLRFMERSEPMRGPSLRIRPSDHKWLPNGVPSPASASV
jgi:hypothetical protein